MLFAKRLRLRAADREDLPRFVAWLNDPEVRSTLALHLPLSQAQEEAWFAKVLQGPPEEFPLVIELSEGERFKPIGNCGFRFLDWHNRSGAIGLQIGEKGLWNKGYGTEIVELLLAHGFGTLNLHRIWLHVFASNKRAIRSYEKAGFVLEGRQRDAVYREGKYEDVLTMSVLRREWAAPQL
jgi:RimJ/RimL family protein N-acetyltransferase